MPPILQFGGVVCCFFTHRPPTLFLSNLHARVRWAVTAAQHPPLKHTVQVFKPLILTVIAQICLRKKFGFVSIKLGLHSNGRRHHKESVWIFIGTRRVHHWIVIVWIVCGGGLDMTNKFVSLSGRRARRPLDTWLGSRLAVPWTCSGFSEQDAAFVLDTVYCPLMNVRKAQDNSSSSVFCEGVVARFSPSTTSYQCPSQPNAPKKLRTCDPKEAMR